MSAAESRLLETVADIALIAGMQKYWSVYYSDCKNDSRTAISNIIAWAKEFETHRTVDAEGNELYLGADYMSAIEMFTYDKLAGINHRT